MVGCTSIMPVALLHNFSISLNFTNCKNTSKLYFVPLPRDHIGSTPPSMPMSPQVYRITKTKVF